MNKKGILGMDMVKVVMVFLLTLAVVAIAIFLALVSLNPTIGTSGSITNTSNFVLIDGPGNNTNAFDNSLSSPILTDLIIWNGTNESVSALVLNSANFTVSLNNGNIIATATSEYNDSLLNITFDFTDINRRQTNFVVTNTTGGVTNFFADIPTIFTILGAVMIILAVTLILFAVSRFSVGSGGAFSSGGKEGGGGNESRL